ncbi:hypothetical protein JOS77_29875 [Chromobacterium haemolyticum]|nr:hypothetical protein JOS77_29875 [Chromobacterium haemolyticum]
MSEEDKRRLEAMGWEQLMDTLRQRLQEQQERHQGGNKWIGTTGGTSPFGAFGYNPAGIRIAQHESRHRRAVKVWDQREFRNFDDSVELGTRNLKIALRRLREFARDGAEEVLDLDATIAATAGKAGMLDLRMQRELRNAVKVLVLFDIGGSMDDHVKGLRGAVLGGEVRVQASGVFLFPQLRLRSRVEGQRPPPHPDLPHLGLDPHFRLRLQADHRRRCHHEPL